MTTLPLITPSDCAVVLVDVQVFDTVGRRVRHVFAGSLSPGPHAMIWDGHDDAGRLARAGAYFVRASKAPGESVVRRVVRMD